MYPVARNLGHCLRTGQIATDDSLPLCMLISETLSHPYHTLPLSFFFFCSDSPLPFKQSLHLYILSSLHLITVRALCEPRPCFPSQLLAHPFLPCSLPLSFTASHRANFSLWRIAREASRHLSRSRSRKFILGTTIHQIYNSPVHIMERCVLELITMIL